MTLLTGKYVYFFHCGREQLDETTERVVHLEKVLDGKEELEKQQKGM